MEKLIELLNKFEAKLEEMPLSRGRWREENWILYRRFMSVEDAERMVISKSFWFIEWLVQNDKIDFEKADTDISKDIVLWREPDFADFMVYRRFLDEEKVLMLLAISENPIEDLISYLK